MGSFGAWQSKEADRLAKAGSAKDARIKELEEALWRRDSLIRALLDNEPDDLVSDAGHTVLEAWRREARRALNEEG